METIMQFDRTARRKQQIDAWNRVFGKDTDYTEGCEETIGEAIVKFMEKMAEKGRDISPKSVESITWHTGDPENTKSVRKRYITKDQANKAQAIISIISLSPQMESVASLEEASQACYDMGVDMLVCDAAESLLIGEDIFFSDKEIKEIVNRARIMRENLVMKRNRVMDITIRNIQLTQELIEQSKKETPEEEPEN